MHTSKWTVRLNCAYAAAATAAATAAGFYLAWMGEIVQLVVKEMKWK